MSVLVACSIVAALLFYGTTRIRPGLADGTERWARVKRAGARVAS